MIAIGVIAAAVVAFGAWLLVQRQAVKRIAEQIGNPKPADVIDMTSRAVTKTQQAADKEERELRDAPLAKKIDFARALRDRGRGVRPGDGDK